MTTITEDDLVASIAEALQFISSNHPADYIENLVEAWRREESPAARDAIGQILTNSRMALLGRRPICQDTGTAQIFMKVGLGAGIQSQRSLQEIADEAVRRAWRAERNPLHASVVADPLPMARRALAVYEIMAMTRTGPVLYSDGRDMPAQSAFVGSLFQVVA